MSYTTESGRTQILADGADAAEQLGTALAALGDVYDQLDDHTADQMENVLFRPLQGALGVLRRTLSEFADRSGLAAPPVASPSVSLPAEPRLVLERVADAAQAADDTIAELQDSLLPVEVGDEALRAGLSRARTLIGSVPGAADQLVRTFGR